MRQPEQPFAFYCSVSYFDILYPGFSRSGPHKPTHLFQARGVIGKISSFELAAKLIAAACKMGIRVIEDHLSSEVSLHEIFGLHNETMPQIEDFLTPQAPLVVMRAMSRSQAREWAVEQRQRRHIHAEFHNRQRELEVLALNMLAQNASIQATSSQTTLSPPPSPSPSPPTGVQPAVQVLRLTQQMLVRQGVADPAHAGLLAMNLGGSTGSAVEQDAVNQTVGQNDSNGSNDSTGPESTDSQQSPRDAQSGVGIESGGDQQPGDESQISPEQGPSHERHSVQVSPNLLIPSLFLSSNSKWIGSGRVGA